MAGEFKRCRILPLAGHQVTFQMDGREKMRWHFGADYPGPFFFPFNGPSGSSLTRMGHPGAPNHDHHRSLWFAHQKLMGIDFWSEQTVARIRQKNWLVYQDGDAQAVMAVSLGWYDGHDPKELLEQTLIAILRPGPDDESLLELQSIFTPIAETIEFHQTNFGILAVRVSASLSEFFGGGRLTNSEGQIGEKDSEGKPVIFGSRARWVDYSGLVSPDCTEGITYFDHPSNPGYPTHWHVRQDGWMGASLCMHEPILVRKNAPLRLRYLLHAHRGGLTATRADSIAHEFSDWPQYDVIRSSRPNHQFELIERPPA